MLDHVKETFHKKRPNRATIPKEKNHPKILAE
jgi:hypothetical protein